MLIIAEHFYLGYLKMLLGWTSVLMLNVLNSITSEKKELIKCTVMPPESDALHYFET